MLFGNRPSKGPLRILIGNNTLELLAGSETWTRTLALSLKTSGHHVECFSSLHGHISDELESHEIICHKEFRNHHRLWRQIANRKRYDVIIANHFHIVNELRNAFPWTPIISTVHGIIHKMKDEQGIEKMAPEHPAIHADVDQFVGVSEEIRDILKQDFDIDALIIRNFFDLNYLKTTKAISPTPKRFLFSSNYNKSLSPEVDIIRQVVKHYGAELINIGYHHSKVSDVREVIEGVDVVVGLGRTVMEGVAMGRIGLVHGHWGTGGVICKQNFESLRQCNFSGRNSKGRFMTPEEIIAEIDRNYTVENTQWGMDYVRREHNASEAAERHVQLARQLIEKGRRYHKFAPVA